MTRAKTHHQLRHISRSITAFSVMVLLAVMAMIVPFWTALAAGIASISLVLFGSTSIVLLVLLMRTKDTAKIFVLTALVASLFGLIVPQAAFVHTAQSHHARLSFNPLTYLTFSGATNLPASEILTYKRTGNHSLQIAFYRSSEPGPRPTVVLLHGGAWRYGSHLETGDWPRLLTENGYHVASVEYRLSGDTYHTWRDTPSDVHDALLFLKKRQKELAIDSGRLHLFGQSAGGHLALLEAYRFKTVQSVISLYAPIDPALDYTTSRDKAAELDFIGGPPAQYPERYRALSPLTYSSFDSPATLLIQGKRDDLVAAKNAIALSDRLEELDVPHSLVLLPLTGHSFENQQGGFATQIAEQEVLRFLNL